MGISLKTNPSRPGWAVLGLLATFVLLAVQGCTSSDQDIRGGRLEATGAIGVGAGELEPAPEIGRRAPDFTLADLEGNPVSLSDFQGKAVFINFWATWCPPCRAEMPEIESIYQKYRDQDVAVIGVDLFEPEDKVREYVQRGGFSWSFVIDTTGVVTRNYGISALPTSFFLDSQGIIRAVNIGPMTERLMEDKLAQATRQMP